MFYFHTMSDFTVGQGARRKASTTVATVVRHGYERLIVNVDGNEYEWYPAECVPVVIETPTHKEESTMATKTSKLPQIIEMFTAAGGVIVTLLYYPASKRFGWQCSLGGCGSFLSEDEARRQIADQLSLA